MTETESLYKVAGQLLLASDYKGAAHSLKSIAKIERYPPALRKLGFLYAHGLGVDKNDHMAEYLLREAVELGDIESAHYLAEVKYNHGSREESIKLYEVAVKADFLPSMYQLAWIFEKSEDEKQRKYSLALFKRAAQKGHVYSIGSYIRRLLRFKFGVLEVLKVPYFTFLLIFNSIRYNQFDPNFRLMK